MTSGVSAMTADKAHTTYIFAVSLHHTCHAAPYDCAKDILLQAANCSAGIFSERKTYV